MFDVIGIRDELAKLGLRVSDSAIRKCRPKTPACPGQTWRPFLRNHLSEIAAMDFFVVPTATLLVLYVFIVLAHERRKAVHVNVTESPTPTGTAQQVVNAFPESTAPRFLLRDRDGVCGTAVAHRIQGLGIEHKLIAPRSPWQNQFVERLIGTIRRECLDLVIILNESHLRRVLRDFLGYFLSWYTLGFSRSIQPFVVAMRSAGLAMSLSSGVARHPPGIHPSGDSKTRCCLGFRASDAFTHRTISH